MKEREQYLAEVAEARRQDEKELVAEINALGFSISSVFDFVNSSASYLKAIPTLLRHLDVPHDPVIREGIIRALTVKGLGSDVQETLLRHFQTETHMGCKWVLANALKTVMPLKKRKLIPEIEEAFRNIKRWN